MSSGLFWKPSNTFFMSLGSFPSWWAPLVPPSNFCDRIITDHIFCGCVHVNTYHSETCKHSNVVTAEDWDRAILEEELCERPRTSNMESEDYCKACQLHKPLKTPNLSLEATCDVYVSNKSLQINIDADEKRQKAVEQIAADNAAEKRFLEINDAWQAHADILIAKGVLELQPNVVAEEGGYVYECTHWLHKDGGIAIQTRSM